MRRQSVKIHSDLQLLVELHSMHQKFHSFLDALSAKITDPAEIELVIKLRQFNMNCLSKYVDLIAKGNLTTQDQPNESSKFKQELSEMNMILWSIHGYLAKFIPVYAAALRSKNLSKVSRMIISNHFDIIIEMKDELLHPVEAVQYA